MGLGTHVGHSNGKSTVTVPGPCVLSKTQEWISRRRAAWAPAGLQIQRSVNPAGSLLDSTSKASVSHTVAQCLPGRDSQPCSLSLWPTQHRWRHADAVTSSTQVLAGRGKQGSALCPLPYSRTCFPGVGHAPFQLWLKVSGLPAGHKDHAV